MKYLLSFLLLLFSYSLYSQGKGYYYEDQFITVNDDSTSVVIIFKEAYFYKNDSSTFISDTSIVSMTVSDGNEDVWFAQLNYNKKIANPKQYLLNVYGISSSEIEDAAYGLTIDNDTVYPTTHLLFRLNHGVVISDLDSFLSPYQASLNEVLYGVYSYKLNSINGTFSLAKELVENNLVVWAEPNMYKKIIFTSDPKYGEQYYLNNTGQTIDGVAGTLDIDIDADKAWAITTGSSNIKVAVLDDGVEDHDDLKDGNGSTRVLNGYTPNCLFGCDGRPRKKDFHGQAVAGIIAASHNNIGIKGIAPNVFIIPIKIGSAEGGLKSDENVAKAIGKAWDDLGADILSNSWAINTPLTNIIEDAFNIARAQGRNGKGSIVVASSGNSGNEVLFPASINGVIAVGAIDLKGDLWNYSSRGSEVDVVASSGKSGRNMGDIRTIDRMGNKGLNNGDYTDNFGGTSAACPQVAGIAALLLSVNPNLTEPEVVCRIQISATDIGTPGFDNDHGYGIANAYHCIALANMDINNENFVGVQKYATKSVMSVGNNTTLTPTANVELVAENTIHFKPGFRAQQGSYMHAYISTQGPCNTGPYRLTPPSQNNEPEPQQQLIEAFNFKVFPNPNTGNFTVYLEESSQAQTVTILNMLGEQVSQINTLEQKLEINLSSYPKGVYFVNVQSNKGASTKKVVVN